MRSASAWAANCFAEDAEKKPERGFIRFGAGAPPGPVVSGVGAGAGVPARANASAGVPVVEPVEFADVKNEWIEHRARRVAHFFEDGRKNASIVVWRLLSTAAV